MSRNNDAIDLKRFARNIAIHEQADGTWIVGVIGRDRLMHAEALAVIDAVKASLDACPYCKGTGLEYVTVDDRGNYITRPCPRECKP